MPKQTHSHSASKNIKIAFILNVCFTVLEIIGGIYINSVAIISDAIHDLGDSFSLGTAWYLEEKSNEKPNSRYSYGYARFSLLGALINSIVLIIGSVFVVYAAIGRLITPEHSDANGMILFAILGMAVNGYAAWKLMGGKTLNEKVVSWHLLEDVLGWVAVLIVGIVLKFKDIEYLDPILSLLITAYILFGVVKRLRETLHLFLQGVPDDLDLNQIQNQIQSLNHVDSMHETRVWSLEGERHVFSTHVVLSDINSLKEIREVKESIHTVLQPYDFVYTTIETELKDERCSVLLE